MSKRYHIGENGPRECDAQPGNCPFKINGEETEHYPTYEKAQKSYETQMKPSLLPKTLRKNNEGITFQENNSPLTAFNYEVKIKPTGKISPEELDENSWKKFGFNGPNLINLKADDKLLTFYNQASVAEISKLKEKEKEALKFFTSSSFAEFNRYIFGNPTKNQEKQEKFEKIKESLDEGLKKSPQLNKIVYRGVKVRASVIGVKPDDDYFTKEKKVSKYVEETFQLGKPVSFDGYQSTSLDPKIATEWADKDGIVFEIMSPNGVNLTSLSKNPEETEILMPRKCRYVVVGVQTHDQLPFSYRRKPSHIIQLVAVDNENNILS